MPLTAAKPDRAPEAGNGRRIAAAVLVAAVAATAVGCENLIARGSGGSETGVDNAEFGIRF